MELIDLCKLSKIPAKLLWATSRSLTCTGISRVGGIVHLAGMTDEGGHRSILLHQVDRVQVDVPEVAINHL